MVLMGSKGTTCSEEYKGGKKPLTQRYNTIFLEEVTLAQNRRPIRLKASGVNWLMGMGGTAESGV